MANDIPPSARIAADIATHLIQLHGGELSSALTTAIGAVILLAGSAGSNADAMFQVALDTIAMGRSLVSENRAADASRLAVTS